MVDRANIIRQARHQAFEVSLLDLLNPRDATTSVLTDRVPKWLDDKLACAGVRIYCEQHGAWILAPLDE
jgi:hypothetical protein